MKLKFVVPLLLLVVTSCGPDYPPEDSEISSKGAFAEFSKKRAGSLINDTSIGKENVVENTTQESLKNESEVNLDSRKTITVAQALKIQNSKAEQRQPEIDTEKSINQEVSDEFVEAKKSLLSDSTDSENTVDQVKLLEQPQEEVRSNIEQLLNKEAKNTESSDEVVKLLKEQADFLVTQANEHIVKFRLKTPKNNNALVSLEQLKKIDPENENIGIIEKSIGKQYLNLAAKQIEEGQKSAAQGYLNSASDFIEDEAILVDYQARVEATKKHIPPPPVVPPVVTQKRTIYRAPKPVPIAIPVAPIACDPVISFSGIPLIGGQSFTAQQSLPISSKSALERSARAVRLTYNRVVASGNQITYEQPTSTNPIKFTLTVVPSGNYSQIKIKAKTPTGIVLKKSGYRRGFCDLLENF